MSSEKRSIVSRVLEGFRSPVPASFRNLAHEILPDDPVARRQFIEDNSAIVSEGVRTFDELAQWWHNLLRAKNPCLVQCYANDDGTQYRYVGMSWSGYARLLSARGNRQPHALNNHGKILEVGDGPYPSDEVKAHVGDYYADLLTDSLGSVKHPVLLEPETVDEYDQMSAAGILPSGAVEQRVIELVRGTSPGGIECFAYLVLGRDRFMDLWRAQNGGATFVVEDWREVLHIGEGAAPPPELKQAMDRQYELVYPVKPNPDVDFSLVTQRSQIAEHAAGLLPRASRDDLVVFATGEMEEDGAPFHAYLAPNRGDYCRAVRQLGHGMPRIRVDLAFSPGVWPFCGRCYRTDDGDILYWGEGAEPPSEVRAAMERQYGRILSLTCKARPEELYPPARG